LEAAVDDLGKARVILEIATSGWVRTSPVQVAVVDAFLDGASRVEYRCHGEALWLVWYALARVGHAGEPRAALDHVYLDARVRHALVLRALVVVLCAIVGGEAASRVGVFVYALAAQIASDQRAASVTQLA
jgi:hypothetical protein